MIKNIVIILVLLVAAGYFVSQIDIASTKISRETAVKKVKALPEVRDYLNRVSNGRVEVDNELEGEYNVQVYEIKDGHTATFSWYRVNIKSGEIIPENY